jgi:hypothetical protein
LKIRHEKTDAYLILVMFESYGTYRKEAAIQAFGEGKAATENA